MLLTVTFPYEWPFWAHASQLPKFSQTSKRFPQQAPNPHTSCLAPGHSTSSQPQFTAWLHRGISKPSTTSNHHRLLYSSCRVTPGRALVGADLGLHHPGNPRACIPNGLLLITLEYHQPGPAQLILHAGQRLVGSGHS